MSLLQQLQSRLQGTVAVVGVGNPFRGDDGAGCSVAERLRGAPRVRAFNGEEVPENVLGQVVQASPDTVVFVDAVDLGAEPGSIALLEKDQLDGHCPTTHRAPLNLLMEFLRLETGADVVLLAIQPAHFDFGRPMSREVDTSVTLLAATIQQACAGPAASTRADSNQLATETLP